MEPAVIQITHLLPHVTDSKETSLPGLAFRFLLRTTESYPSRTSAAPSSPIASLACTIYGCV